MTFGSRLKRLRKERGLTQEGLAAMLFVSRQSITKWEGDRGLPNDEIIDKLSELFGVTRDYLLGLDMINKKRRRNMIIIRSTLVGLILILLSVMIYLIIYFIYLVPNKEEVVEPTPTPPVVLEDDRVAFYLSFDNEELGLAELDGSTLPYAIFDNDQIRTNRFSYNGYSYSFYIPMNFNGDIYSHEISYSKEKNEYSYKSEKIINTKYFGVIIKDIGFGIARINPVVKLNIYSFDLRQKLIKEETFRVDKEGRIYSVEGGYIDTPYLNTYKIEGAFSYNVEIIIGSGDRTVIPINESKRLLVFFNNPNWASMNYLPEIEFII